MDRRQNIEQRARMIKLPMDSLAKLSMVSTAMLSRWLRGIGNMSEDAIRTVEAYLADCEAVVAAYAPAELKLNNISALRPLLDAAHTGKLTVTKVEAVEVTT
ncbi:MAG TPA: hypothetical protein VFU57_08970 [Candidatus Acidoferrales bacterium]|nr:hypothetical protein [Candidatus Acidoferrales bacterium]